MKIIEIISRESGEKKEVKVTDSFIRKFRKSQLKYYLLKQEKKLLESNGENVEEVKQKLELAESNLKGYTDQLKKIAEEQKQTSFQQRKNGWYKGFKKIAYGLLIAPSVLFSVLFFVVFSPVLLIAKGIRNRMENKHRNTKGGVANKTAALEDDLPNAQAKAKEHEDDRYLGSIDLDTNAPYVTESPTYTIPPSPEDYTSRSVVSTEETNPSYLEDESRQQKVDDESRSKQFGVKSSETQQQDDDTAKTKQQGNLSKTVKPPSGGTELEPKYAFYPGSTLSVDDQGKIVIVSEKIDGLKQFIRSNNGLAIVEDPKGEDKFRIVRISPKGGGLLTSFFQVDRLGKRVSVTSESHKDTNSISDPQQLKGDDEVQSNYQEGNQVNAVIIEDLGMVSRAHSSSVIGNPNEGDRSEKAKESKEFVVELSDSSIVSALSYDGDQESVTDNSVVSTRSLKDEDNEANREVLGDTPELKQDLLNKYQTYPTAEENTEVSSVSSNEELERSKAFLKGETNKKPYAKAIDLSKLGGKGEVFGNTESSTWHSRNLRRRRLTQRKPNRGV